MVKVYLNNIKMMKKKIYGAERYRLVLFGIEVQQRLSMSRIKRLNNPNWRIFAKRVGNRLAFIRNGYASC